MQNYFIIPGLTECKEKTAKKYLQMVCNHYGISMDDITGNRRNRAIVSARYVAAIMMLGAGITRVKSGLLLNRDHATIVHGISTIKNLLKFDREFIKDLQNSPEIFTIVTNTLETIRKKKLKQSDYNINTL